MFCKNVPCISTSIMKWLSCQSKIEISPRNILAPHSNVFTQFIADWFNKLLIQYFVFYYYQDLPFDISVCVFVLEQALSVRALQEMVSSKSKDTVSIQT